MSLFRCAPKVHNYPWIGHAPSKNHAYICAGLHAGLDSIKVVLEYESLMEKVKYPVEIIYPDDWTGIKPNPFFSYEDWRQQFLFPVLSEFVEFADRLLTKDGDK